MTDRTSAFSVAPTSVTSALRTPAFSVSIADVSVVPPAVRAHAPAFSVSPQAAASAASRSPVFAVSAADAAVTPPAVRVSTPTFSISAASASITPPAARTQAPAFSVSAAAAAVTPPAVKSVASLFTVSPSSVSPSQPQSMRTPATVSPQPIKVAAPLLSVSTSTPHAPAISAQSSPSQQAQLGSLHVQVCKASGKVFESSIRCLIQLTVGSERRGSAARKHPLGSKKKPVVWDESFTFPIYHHAETLTVTCVREDDSTSIGSAIIALSHLPQATQVTKWFELKKNGESIAVLQLHLTHHLTYTFATVPMHHGQQHHRGSLSRVPSHQAREQIRKAILASAANTGKHYRFIDYFCVVGVESPVLGNHSHNTPTILSRFPAESRSDVSLPNEIGMFAFADGYELSVTHREPECCTFRLNADMDQLMVTCLMYWAPEQILDNSDNDSALHESDTSADEFLLPATMSPRLFDRTRAKSRTQSSLTTDSDRHAVTMFAPRVLLLTSRLSFVPQHREILTQLYQHYFDQSNIASLPIISLPCPYSKTEPVADSPSFPCVLTCPCTSDIPLDCTGHTLEDMLTLLLSELPLPVPGSTPIDFDVSCRRYRLLLPSSELDFPSLEFSLVDLFLVLDTDTVLMALQCILSEMKIIFYSSSKSLLHSVTECLLSLCFPFHWSHIYIPLLPKSLWAILDAPVSFLCGIHSESTPNLDHVHDLSQFAIIDIDRSSIDVAVPPPMLPAHNVRILMKGLRKLTRPQVFRADLLQSIRRADRPLSVSDEQRQHEHCLHGDRSQFASSDYHTIQSQSHHSKVVNPSIEHTNRAIRFEFFHFFASLLHNYRDHLFFVNGSLPSFAIPSFLSSEDKREALPFLSKFVTTQLFRDFLDRHVESPSYLSDFLTYLSLHRGNDEGRAFYVAQQRPRSLAEWSRLLHANQSQPHDRAVDQQANFAATAPVPTFAINDEAENGQKSDALSSARSIEDEKDVSVRFESQTSPSRDRTVSYPVRIDGSPNAVHGSRSLSHATPNGSARPSAVLSLAPAVATFLSSQTFVTTSQSAPVQVPLSPRPYSSSSVFRSWLLPQPRVFTVPGSEFHTLPSAKNPCTLLHMPLSRDNGDDSDDESSLNSRAETRDDEPFVSQWHEPSQSHSHGHRHVMVNNVIHESDEIRIAIQSPQRKHSFATLHQTFSPQPDKHRSINDSPLSSPDRSPLPYEHPPRTPSPASASSMLADHPAIPRPRSAQRSRHDSFTSNPFLRPQVHRQQSTNLLSKSELEKKRSAKDQRLIILLSSIMDRGNQSSIDVGELSAVGELLALREWREQLCETLGAQYGLYDLHGQHRFINVEAFTALLLLFNVAFEECEADGDYVSAYLLLQFTSRIYTIATNVVAPVTPTSAMAGVAPIGLPSFHERIYLLSSLKCHKLWSVMALWELSYSAEVHRHRHGAWPRQPCEICEVESENSGARRNQDDLDEDEWRRVEADRHAAESEALKEICFESMVFLINTMATVGCKESHIVNFIELTCGDDEHISDRQTVLQQLAHNSSAAQQSLVRAAPQPRITEQTAIPLPGAPMARRGSSAGDYSSAGNATLAKYVSGTREFRLEDM